MEQNTLPDEISLVDIVAVFARHARLFYWSMIVMIGLASSLFIFARMLPHHYKLSHIIQPAYYTLNGQQQEVIPLQQINAILNILVLPQMSSEIIQRNYLKIEGGTAKFNYQVLDKVNQSAKQSVSLSNYISLQTVASKKDLTLFNKKVAHIYSQFKGQTQSQFDYFKQATTKKRDFLEQSLKNNMIMLTKITAQLDFFSKHYNNRIVKKPVHSVSYSADHEVQSDSADFLMQGLVRVSQLSDKQLAIQKIIQNIKLKLLSTNNILTTLTPISLRATTTIQPKQRFIGSFKFLGLSILASFFLAILVVLFVSLWQKGCQLNKK